MLRGNSDGGKSSLPETEEVATMLDNAGPAVNAIFLVIFRKLDRFTTIESMSQWINYQFTLHNLWIAPSAQIFPQPTIQLLIPEAAVLAFQNPMVLVWPHD